jgi:hypothetical protein
MWMFFRFIPTDTGPQVKKIMISGKLFRQVLEKILKQSPTAQEARMQVAFPNGESYDIQSIQLLENKLLGARETHRIVLTIKPEQWRMGKVVNSLGKIDFK